MPIREQLPTLPGHYPWKDEYKRRAVMLPGLYQWKMNGREHLSHCLAFIKERWMIDKLHRNWMNLIQQYWTLQQLGGYIHIFVNDVNTFWFTSKLKFYTTIGDPGWVSRVWKILRKISLENLLIGLCTRQYLFVYILVDCICKIWIF